MTEEEVGLGFIHPEFQNFSDCRVAIGVALSSEGYRSRVGES